jgi:murein DD-endopeptidase MepM/ murein hydrolase activator NlpD
MNGRTIAITCAVVAAVLLLCLAGPVVLFAGAASTICGPATSPPTQASTTSPRQWDDEQVANAATIVTVGGRMAVPPRGWVIAVATAMQESGLRNIGDLGRRNDHDSLGLFQQRPSQGWGTPQQLMDPQYAASKFYQTLLAIDGWQAMPLAEAAQVVQRSAYPGAYQRWEADATVLVQRVLSGSSPAGTGTTDLCVELPSESGWMAPVRAPVVSGFRTPERPTHQGVDLAASRGTIIRAAASGTVLTARCNVAPEAHGCDRDGSQEIKGCGWYVDLQHAAGVITRYCHMQTQPFVHEGQTVLVGQPLGLVGSSGHSSGPHLHYETHLNNDRSPAGAVDPVRFMRDVGKPLGETG